MNIPSDTYRPFSLPPLFPGLAETQANERALAQLRQTHRTFSQLLNLAPNVVQILNDALRALFNTDPEHCGLHFDASSSLLINLPSLAAYVRHHPIAPTDLDRRATLQGRDGTHAKVLELRPSELHARLRALDIPTLVRQRWQGYWQARAKGTPSSRLAVAQQQYRLHFMASVEIALTNRFLTQEQARPVFALLDNPEWLRIDNKRIAIEALAQPVGGLLISIENEAGQVLYRPDRHPAFSFHASRQAMETVLDITGENTNVYTPLEDIGDGCTALVNGLLSTLLATLDHNPGDDIGQHAGQALHLAKELASAWSASEFFSLPPSPPPLPASCVPHPTLFDLGGMEANISLSVRSSTVQQQLHLLNALPDAQRAQRKHCQQALEAACTAAKNAIQSMLASPKWHSAAVPPPASPGLVQAHRDGLLAHARFQHLLQQIDDQQLHWVESLISGSAGEAVVAQVALSMPVNPTTSQQTIRDTIPGALVITARSHLTQATKGAMLLYWAGEHGGLLRCANRAELEHCFHASLDPDIALDLSEIEGDAISHMLATQLKASYQAKQWIQNTQGLDAAATALPGIREDLEKGLGVARHAAREIALRLVAQHDHIVATAGAPLNKLQAMPANTRGRLKVLLDDYLIALSNSNALIERELPDRQDFCRQRIERRLKQDFDGYLGEAISLQLPVSARIGRVSTVPGPGGTPTKQGLLPSPEREILPLETVLVEHIDDAMLARLKFLTVQVKTPNAKLRDDLVAGITDSYLHSVASELDLGQHYEDLISTTFMGQDDTGFQFAYRRETLIEPYRLMLKLQSLLFHESGYLSDYSNAMLAIAIDATSKDQWQVDNHDIRMLPATLTAGGKDTHEQPTTLTGVTFIEDQASKTTVLYRPDHPTSPLRQYADLESARLSLYEGCADELEIKYLLSRALQGDPRAHRARILQAQARHYDGMIGLGAAWPASMSLAHVQLNAEMGRLIHANRATSRSNQDLALAYLAGQAGKVLIGFKLALGIVPILGLPMGLYDLFESSAELVKAIGDGKTVDILDAIQNVLASIIDVAMDLLGGGIGITPASIRQATNRQQLRRLHDHGTLLKHLSTTDESRRARFAGYEAEDNLSLDGLKPGATGQYQGIYRLGQAHYIEVHGRPVEVSWSAADNTWELAGNRQKTYRRAIALDDQGNWDTHFALYGVHRLGAGAGGGQALYRLADTLEPLWPSAVRERLPRWWTERAYRRHQQLRESITRDTATFHTQASALNERMKQSFQLTDAHDASLISRLKNCIVQAKRIHGDCLAFEEVSSGRIRNSARLQANDLAMVACDGHYRVIELARKRLKEILDNIDNISAALRTKTEGLATVQSPSQLPALTQELLGLRKQMHDARWTALEEIDEIRRQIEGLRVWRGKVNQVGNRAELFKDIDLELATLNDATLNYLSAGNLLALIVKLPETLEGSWISLQRLLQKPRSDLDRAMYVLHELHNANPSASQRQAILAHSLDTISQFRSKLRYCETSYAQHFDTASTQRFVTHLDAYAEYFRNFLRNRQKPLPAATHTGSSRPRVFETTPNQWLIGTVNQQQPHIYRITGPGGRTELWVRNGDGTFTLSNPETRLPSVRTATLAELQREGQRHLDELAAFNRKVDRYAAQGMDGASLEDTLLFKAHDLEHQATQIAQQAPEDALVSQLRNAARTVTARGRQLRIDNVLRTREPTAGQLRYLVEQDVVSIDKVGGLTELKRTPDGRRDFLQEFVIKDSRSLPAKPVWYAHFHYNKQNPAFGDFVKAHLKTPAQRYLGREWQDNHLEVIWRGDIPRDEAQRHFASVF
ncbi:hypothetical protein AWT69_001133 [Pseudomonas putida]|nr:hypothetical protein AWT69_001133 [Pseudomonas putida]